MKSTLTPASAKAFARRSISFSRSGVFQDSPTAKATCFGDTGVMNS